ncbi:MAG TPA: hypothetical protein VFV67_03825 [Actinophytocola sp.]|uniref:hypothetical protein n=1 Tax=Actinophytocola sp. TaxID=1872138 RepID=UPI002DBA110B|nr:hypothetical protein [Actinophytocola sp.]HEU5469755.1 hypothetical protein [Actinophytocola sp.]
MPRITVAEQAGVGLDGAPRPSEDVVLVRPDAVIVLDGATSLRPELPSGGWYAHRLAGQLAEELAAHPDAALPDLLAGAIGTLAAAAGLTPGHSPSSTVALLRWTADRVDALVLGDSPVVAFGPDGPRVLADDRLAAVPRRGGGYRDRLRSGTGYGAGHLRALRAGGAAMDRLRNREGGFWIAEADPRAGHRARTARWPRSAVREVLMTTDGVSCAVDDYGIFPDWPAVLRHSVDKGLLSVLEMVRAAERTDPHGIRWPRPKPHDDQALVHVDFTEIPK